MRTAFDLFTVVQMCILQCVWTHIKKREKKKSSTLHSSQCENAVAHKSEVTTTTGRTNEAQANTCRFLWRRALNSPNWFSFGRGAASSSSCQLKASRYIPKQTGKSAEARTQKPAKRKRGRAEKRRGQGLNASMWCRCSVVLQSFWLGWFE